MLSKFKLNQLYFKDTQFANLMTRRIFNVLLIANPYDAFMLEDDGRIDEKIFNEYTSLSLRYPPRFSQVSTEEEALRQLESVSFDLVICMPGTGDNDSFDIGRHIKEKYEQIPIVILTPFSHGITKRIANVHYQYLQHYHCHPYLCILFHRRHWHIHKSILNTHPAMIPSTLWIDVLFPSYIHQLSKLLLVHFRKEVFQCIHKHIMLKQFLNLLPIHPCNLRHFICCGIA